MCEDKLPELVHAGVKVEWVNLDEGKFGEYDPEDPTDINLLRFDISKLVDGEWVPVPDGSFCTRMAAHAPNHILEAALVVIWGRVYEDVMAHGKCKDGCEEMSWLSLKSFP